MSHIVLVTADPMPSPRANGVQTAHTAAAFAALGHTVTLIASRPEQATQSVADTYGLPHSFAVLTLASWRPPPHWRNRKRIASLTFLPLLLLTLLRLRLREPLIIYSREDHYTGYLFLLLRHVPGIAIFFESHYFPPTNRNLGWQVKMDGIVTINHPLKQAYLDAGVPEAQLGVAPDGVDVARFTPQQSQQEARAGLNLPQKTPLLLYTGHLFAWKGVFVLAEAMRHLPHAHCVIVGGLKADQQALAQFIEEQEIKNVQLVGQVAATAVPPYLWAADALILPNSGKKEISRLYTSPLKLFEYMAAQRPIVASDLPSIRDVLTHGRNAHLVPADDPAALAAGVRAVLADEQYAANLAAQAADDVHQYSWQNRAQRIVDFMEQHA